MHTVKIYNDRQAIPNRIIVGNRYESEIEQIRFEGPDYEGNKYLIINKQGESYAIPLKDNLFHVDSLLTWRSGLYDSNYVITQQDLTDGKLDGTKLTFISNTLTLVVRNNSINAESLSKQPLPVNLQIVYDQLFNTYEQIKSDYDSGVFDGKDGQSAYELAVENGFEGTEEEWLESLRYDHSDEFKQLADQVKQDATDAENSASEAKKAMNEANTTAQENVEAINQASTNAQNAITTTKDNAVQAVQNAQQTAENAIGTKQTEAVQAVDTAKTSATQAIAEQKESAVSAITQERSEAIEAIKTGRIESLESIETAKDEAIEEIENTGVPLEDIEKLAIKETATGNPTIISDSADWRLQSLNVYGQSSQDGTPTPENPIEIISKEISQITVTNGADLSQTVMLTEPITLRGIPVDKGGNVTIDGQQYVSDVICEKDGVYGVERKVHERILNGTESWSIDTQLENTTLFYTPNESGNDSARSGDKVLSNYLQHNVMWRKDEEGVYVDDRYTVLRINKSIVGESQDSINQWLQALNPKLNILNITISPTFEPLPEDIQSQIKALKSYHPNTVIQTGCWNEVEYVADTKTWMKNKLNGVTELALGGK